MRYYIPNYSSILSIKSKGGVFGRDNIVKLLTCESFHIILSSFVDERIDSEHWDQDTGNWIRNYSTGYETGVITTKKTANKNPHSYQDEFSVSCTYYHGDIMAEMEIWSQYGVLHREDGPAFIYSSEGHITRLYMKNGFLHHPTGPAIWAGINGKPTFQAFARDGVFHRIIDKNDERAVLPKRGTFRLDDFQAWCQEHRIQYQGDHTRFQQENFTHISDYVMFEEEFLRYHMENKS